MIDHVDNLCVVLDGNADAKFNVLGNISGNISSGNITLYQTLLPISSLVIPEYVTADPRPHTMDSSSRLIVESLKSVPNLRYWAALTLISDLQM
jgi:hypothetical protein